MSKEQVYVGYAPVVATPVLAFPYENTVLAVPESFPSTVVEQGGNSTASAPLLPTSWPQPPQDALTNFQNKYEIQPKVMALF